ncbi:MAG: DUF2914 domain-containing protein [Deltaproteobacteria bacterium]|nr:DUF2914 domain-containing protein [Deltaproteobacteria bacterium]
MLTRAVEEREPVGAVAVFGAGGDQVWAWYRLENLGPGTTVEVSWLREGEVRGVATLEVGTGPRWRTWARRRLSAADAGAWTVELRARDGALLDRQRFDVSAPGAEPRVPGRPGC